MLRFLFLMFLLLPLLELYVLIEVGSDIGGLMTIALCLLTAAMGGLIIRFQGLQTLMRARESITTMQQHQLAEQGAHALMLVVAGVLLFIPGFITDTMGFLLLIPSFRRLLMPKHVLAYTQHTSAPRQHQRYPEVIDVEIIKKD